MKKEKVISKKPVSDYILTILVAVVMIVMVIATLYPFLNSLAISLNNADDTTKGGITIWPRVFTLANYANIFRNPKVGNAYVITIARTLIGTLTGLMFTAMLAFALSRSKLIGRKYYVMLCLIPMYFGGGLMPTYFLIKGLGLTNNFWVYIIPNLLNLWNMILLRSYFQSLPEALEESARIDGASYFTIFRKIFLPLSTPILATIALYIGVYHWNDWFMPNIYIKDQNLKPMQSVLLSIISEARYAEAMAAAGASVSSEAISSAGKGKNVNVRSVTMATMIVTIIPIILTYPFLQRYFVKGVMIGSVKG